MRSRVSLCGIAILLALLAWSVPASGEDRAGYDYFEKYVRPVLAQQCYACHSGQIPVPQAGLSVDSRDGLVSGGQSGPALVPGDPDASLLVRVLRHTERVKMPPTGKLADAEVDRIATWIRMGAPYPGSGATVAAQASGGERHWAFVPPQAASPPPAVSGWAKTSIDRFVEARLATEGLEPSPEAPPRTLVRRLYYDLTGLPPDPAETDAFERSPTEESYASMVDSLLASDRFGERWARHWLDVVRYSDEGYFAQPFPIAWTYRDWVVDAFNSDLPYDKFLVYQIAADLAGAGTEHQPAMGMLALGTNLPRPSDVPENLDDRIDVVTRGLLGLSVACARCHDHKFDRITQEDYYSLYGVFLNSPNVLEPLPLEPIDAGPETDFFRDKLAMRREWLDKYREERLADHIGDFREPATLARYLEAAWAGRDLSNREAEALSKEKDLNLYMLNRWRAYLRGLVGPSVEVFSELDSEGGAGRIARRMAEADSAYRWPDPEREALRLAFRGNGSPTDVPVEDFWWIQNEGDSNVMKSLKWRYESVMYEWSHRGGPRHASVVGDAKAMQPAFVFVRGNQYDKGKEVTRRFLSALPGPEAFESGSGRLELARAIASVENPLAARVMVNRAWGHLFGEGIVRTPSDFGIRGDRPTHPELLDYLATEFMANGWSVKDLIRRIVLSRSYRQASSDTEAGLALDPDNRLLWRQNRVRLDFEAMRDSMLLVAGRLDTTMGGTPFDLSARPSAPRRSIYAYVSRWALSQLMRTFDFSNPEEHTPRRQLTTVPQQALFLMNSWFMAEQVRAIAAGCGDPDQCVESIHRRVLGRAPDPQELRDARDFVQRRAAAEAASDDVAARNRPWRQGTARIDPLTGSVSGFQAMGHRVDDTVQPLPMLPSPGFGRASLTAAGGFPGDDTDCVVVRRWEAPRAMSVAVSGTLGHSMGSQSLRFNYSNGVRGWIVSSERGMVASWTVRGFEAETAVRNLAVTDGEHLDFVVDSLGDYEGDSFRWSPRIEEILLPDSQNADMEPQVWSAEDGFAEPAEERLTAFEQYAQVLLMTNEFAFRD